MILQYISTILQIFLSYFSMISWYFSIFSRYLSTIWWYCRYLHNILVRFHNDLVYLHSTPAYSHDISVHFHDGLVHFHDTKYILMQEKLREGTRRSPRCIFACDCQPSFLFCRVTFWGYSHVTLNNGTDSDSWIRKLDRNIAWLSVHLSLWSSSDRTVTKIFSRCLIALRAMASAATLTLYGCVYPIMCDWNVCFVHVW